MHKKFEALQSRINKKCNENDRIRCNNKQWKKEKGEEGKVQRYKKNHSCAEIKSEDNVYLQITRFSEEEKNCEGESQPYQIRYIPSVHWGGSNTYIGKDHQINECWSSLNYFLIKRETGVRWAAHDSLAAQVHCRFFKVAVTDGLVIKICEEICGCSNNLIGDQGLWRNQAAVILWLCDQGLWRSSVAVTVWLSDQGQWRNCCLLVLTTLYSFK